MADQAGLFPFDFAGYFAGAGGASRHGSFGLSIHDVFFLYREQAIRQARAEAEMVRVENVLAAHKEAVYTRRYEAWRKNWAATYTTLLTEV